MFEANEFSKSVFDGYTSGEGIWARSMTEVLQSLGYTYLYAEGMDQGQSPVAQSISLQSRRKRLTFLCAS